MKLLHSADWHLGAPITGRTATQSALLRQYLLSLPQRICALARQEQCDLMLLSGDLFDGPCSAEALQGVQRALAEAAMPVFIAPGNHDPAAPGSPWEQPGWPENVHIFRSAVPQSVVLPTLSCRVWGAAFTQAHSPALLEGFRAEGTEQWALGVFHADPTQPDSPYNPVSRSQVLESGLNYLALGHIHKGGSFSMGDTLCAWPGCPMGRGFDETGEKGVLIVTLEQSCSVRFFPLPLPRFHWLTVPAGDDVCAAISSVLPASGGDDFYRVTLTGESAPLDPATLLCRFPAYPNLELQDATVAPLALWDSADEDSLEGVYFRLLQQADAPEDIREQAARLSRLLLSGQEVAL